MVKISFCQNRKTKGSRVKGLFLCALHFKNIKCYPVLKRKEDDKNFILPESKNKRVKVAYFFFSALLSIHASRSQVHNQLASEPALFIHFLVLLYFFLVYLFDSFIFGFRVRLHIHLNVHQLLLCFLCYRLAGFRLRLLCHLDIHQLLLCSRLHGRLLQILAGFRPRLHIHLGYRQLLLYFFFML